MKTIGPFVGELGWELMIWRPYLRHRYPTGEGLVVQSRHGREYLYDWLLRSGARYRGFNLGVHNTSGFHHEGRMPDEMTEHKSIYRFQGGCPVLAVPGIHEPLWHDRRRPTRPFVLLHARAIDSNAQRNWPLGKWSDLASRLMRNGAACASVGHPGGAEHVSGSTDGRTHLLHTLAVLCSMATAIVGPSSGPMHVASMARCPQVVWSEAEKDRDRYTELWNPLDTPVRFIQEEAPSVERVFEEVLACV